MTSTAMEDRLENLDRRLDRIEQILPTLATKDDLKAFATKDDLAAFARKAEQTFAAKDDLKAYATREDVEQMAAQQKALTESVIARVNTMFDVLDHRVSSQNTEIKGIAHVLDVLVKRLEAKSVI